MKENDDLGKDNKKRKKEITIILISQFPLETWVMSPIVYILYAWVTIFLVSIKFHYLSKNGIILIVIA